MNIKLSKLFLAVIVGIVFNIILGFRNDTDRVSAADNIQTTKTFTSIEIEDGDTLWSIAQEYADTDYITYEDYIEEIMTSNHISAFDLETGKFLLIPCYNKTVY